jgi:hypothetical protein
VAQEAGPRGGHLQQAAQLLQVLFGLYGTMGVGFQDALPEREYNQTGSRDRYGDDFSKTIYCSILVYLLEWMTHSNFYFYYYFSLSC